MSIHEKPAGSEVGELGGGMDRAELAKLAQEWQTSIVQPGHKARVVS
jgi:hypothetical protein